MQANPRFSRQTKPFWACVRVIGQAVGYTVRGQNSIKVPTLQEIHDAYAGLKLSTADLGTVAAPSPLAQELHAYFEYRADILKNLVAPRLMDVDAAKALFLQLKNEHQPTCPLPLNKQKGEKKAEAYFTGIINTLIQANVGDNDCDYDPRTLTSITNNNSPLRTLSRRVDGAFPSAIDPVAIWEIKEYYYTTTFGSRVADGVYETLLDGMELHELFEHENRKVLHYLMVDSHYTWWVCGRSYLCRIIDMLNTGYVDEVLFGSEVVGRIPQIAQGWVTQLRELPGGA